MRTGSQVILPGKMKVKKKNVLTSNLVVDHSVLQQGIFSQRNNMVTFPSHTLARRHPEIILEGYVH